MMTDEAKSTIENSHYDSESLRYSYHKHVGIHENAHLVMERYGKPLDEDEKVRKFIDSIAYNSAEMKAAIAVVKGDSVKKNSFVLTKNYLATAIPKKHPVKYRHLSGIDSNDKNDGGDGKPKLSGTKTYSKEVWWDVFDDDDRAKVAELRAEAQSNKDRSKRKRGRRKKTTPTKDTGGAESTDDSNTDDSSTDGTSDDDNASVQDRRAAKNKNKKSKGE